MGNEQSAPAPRAPRNKLSKPRTNSSANTSGSKSSGISKTQGRRNSQSDHVGISNNRYSTVSVDAVFGGAGEKRRDESTRRKRMSIFRLKSSQAKIQQLEVGSGVSIDYLDPEDRWSRSNSVTEDLRDQRHYSAPVERYWFH